MSPAAGQIIPAIDRVLSKVIVDDSGCWIFTGTTACQGYGQVTEGGTRSRKRPAHRVTYEHFVGPIPEGLQLDHLCRVRACVNPAHLEPVTCRENVLRGSGLAAINALKTHCSRGHPYDEENTYIRPGKPTRECRTCRRQAKLAARALKSAL